MVKIVRANSLEEECQILEQELRDKRRKYWDDYGKPVPGLITTIPVNPLDLKHPLLLPMPWDNFSKFRVAGGSILYSCLMEGLTLHYVQYSHLNHISYTGTIAGVMKQTLQTEGLNAFRTSFPPLAIHSPLAKTLFIPIFEYLRTKMWIPLMEKDSVEEVAVRTGVSASAASLAVFWFSRAGELNNILNSKFHTLTQKMNPLPFGMFSAVPKHGSPFYNTRNNALMFTTRFLFPNLIWWPTYMYTKNLLSQEELDPYVGAAYTIGVSALAASAATTLACQPIFLLRDTIGSSSISKLLSGDSEVYKKFKSLNTPYSFYITRQLLGRFIVGAPICVIGAYSYELLRGAFLDPRRWKDYSY